ncbi:uncharacterized protein si:dkeyp-97b10.3 isoform X2 [Dunckerocampus dactyliophorus]|uniref:uncharacterized protein si:dkeyp-97b10.3 isoform X2 n=1 Tax=Dunckerocampus dactyliophorus TaxID=161453 RepID=UPI002406638A|nr:uncharacterized protein si:dkeyp-97b10.3 isoform X2 [Dunckerocampus dactyliophorus]
MVAKMSSLTVVCHPEDGEKDVPLVGNKDNVTESDSSETTETSTEESSEEEEDEEKENDGGNTNKKGEEEEEEEEGKKEADGSQNEAGVSAPEDLTWKAEKYIHFNCEKCKDIQQTHGKEVVAPKIIKGQYQVQLEGEGTYECSVTRLVFEASDRVLVRYSVASWSKYCSPLKESWKFAGPIFDVKTDKDASVLKSIQFPHSVCLADAENEMTFGMLHIKNKRPFIEPAADHSGSHIKWHVTSLSPVGPMVRTSRPTDHHGVVLVYRQLANDDDKYSFHIYLATNSSEIKDIRKQVGKYTKRYVQIEKPPTCTLNEGTYRLLSKPEGAIEPQVLEFTLAMTKMKGFFEVFFEHPPPFELSLIKSDTDETVWSTTIREGDCTGTGRVQPEKKPRKRTNCRRRSSSLSEDEADFKKRRLKVESDHVKVSMPGSRDMSEKQLLQVAKCLGKEWKQVAIYLGLSIRELDDIQAAEKDVTMQKMKMMVEWKSRRGAGQATAFQLRKCLEELDDLPTEVHQILQDMNNQEDKR